MLDTLNDLYFSLNEFLLYDLEKKAKQDYKRSLGELFIIYCENYPNTLNIEELKAIKNNDSISCMIDYYDLLEYIGEKVIDIERG